MSQKKWQTIDWKLVSIGSNSFCWDHTIELHFTPVYRNSIDNNGTLKNAQIKIFLSLVFVVCYVRLFLVSLKCNWRAKKKSIYNLSYLSYDCVYSCACVNVYACVWESGIFLSATSNFAISDCARTIRTFYPVCICLCWSTLCRIMCWPTCFLSLLWTLFFCCFQINNIRIKLKLQLFCVLFFVY